MLTERNALLPKRFRLTRRFPVCHDAKTAIAASKKFAAEADWTKVKRCHFLFENLTA